MNNFDKKFLEEIDKLDKQTDWDALKKDVDAVDKKTDWATLEKELDDLEKQIQEDESASSK